MGPPIFVGSLSPASSTRDLLGACLTLARRDPFNAVTGEIIFSKAALAPTDLNGQEKRLLAVKMRRGRHCKFKGDTRRHLLIIFGQWEKSSQAPISYFELYV